MAQPEVVVLSGVRTAIGDYGGGLKDKPPTELGAAVIREAVKRAGIQPEEVGHVVFGNVIHTDVHDMYLARVAAIHGGLPVETPALTLNRLCGSGLQAIVSAAQTIYMGDTTVAIGGGAEVMSRSQYWLPTTRWGQRMGDGKVIDAMVGALSDPFDDCHMGITAENVAEKWGITRHCVVSRRPGGGWHLYPAGSGRGGRPGCRGGADLPRVHPTASGRVASPVLGGSAQRSRLATLEGVLTSLSTARH
jgi:acetyl-CoA acetyltransferase